jgi:hypothetical protein
MRATSGLGYWAIRALIWYSCRQKICGEGVVVGVCGGVGGDDLAVRTQAAVAGAVNQRWLSVMRQSARWRTARTTPAVLMRPLAHIAWRFSVEGKRRRAAARVGRAQLTWV